MTAEHWPQWGWLSVELDPSYLLFLTEVEVGVQSSILTDQGQVVRVIGGVCKWVKGWLAEFFSGFLSHHHPSHSPKSPLGGTTFLPN